jgi:hypothetical protein
VGKKLMDSWCKKRYSLFFYQFIWILRHYKIHKNELDDIQTKKTAATEAPESKYNTIIDTKII